MTEIEFAKYILTPLAFIVGAAVLWVILEQIHKDFK